MKRSHFKNLISASLLMLAMSGANSSENGTDIEPKTAMSLIKHDAMAGKLGYFGVEWRLDVDYELNDELLSVAKTVETGDTKTLAPKIIKSIIDQGLAGDNENNFPIVLYCHESHVMLVTSMEEAKKMKGYRSACNSI